MTYWPTIFIKELGKTTGRGMFKLFTVSWFMVDFYSLVSRQGRVLIKELSLATNPNFLIPISLKPDGVNL